MLLRSLIVAAFVAAIGLSLSACAQHSGALPAVSLDALSPLASPPKCKGQKGNKQYATLTAPLKSSGGAFCIPAIGGFGGKLEYPDASFKGSVNLRLTSSVKNYNHQPNLGSGTPIFYIQFAISNGVKFGNKLKRGGGLTGAKIASGGAYTLYGQATVFGQNVNFGPCSTTATKGKYGGVIGEIGSLIKNEDVPFAASGVIEIYSGQQTSYGC